MISIRDLQFSWPSGEFQLHVPRLDVASHSSTVITGPSGSGKTTLLNLIAGILTPTAGTLTIGDTRLSTLSDRQRRTFRLQQIGLVFQSFELIEYLSVLDNILLPARISPALTLTPDLRQRAADLLAQAGLAHFGSRSVGRLSQGERQRVAVCRALLPNPSLLLADEPTGNLDPHSTQRVVSLLLDQVRQQKTTLLMVSHDHSLLTQFDTVLDFSSLHRLRPVAAGESDAQ